MDRASEAILSLQPVIFRYKKELDQRGVPQFGLVAEQVAKVDRDLVVCDDQGKPFTVRYDEVNAMLLNEFLKAHRKLEVLGQESRAQEAAMTQLGSIVDRQEAMIVEHRQVIAALISTVKEQAAQIRKVSHDFEAEKPAQRLMVSTQ